MHYVILNSGACGRMVRTGPGMGQARVASGPLYALCGRMVRTGPGMGQARVASGPLYALTLIHVL